MKKNTKLILGIGMGAAALYLLVFRKKQATAAAEEEYGMAPHVQVDPKAAALLRAGALPKRKLVLPLDWKERAGLTGWGW